MKSQWISTSKRAISDEDANKEDIKRQRKEDMSKLKSELNQLKKRKRNTAVYVSNLPIDLTVTDIEHAFNNFGKIQVGKDGNLKIKMYNDDSGKFKGEALVIFAQPDSASLAIEMMDNSLFNGQNIRVEEAKFDEKKDVPNKTEPGVVIRSMFRKDEFETDEYLKQDIIDDIKDECEKLGINVSGSIQFNVKDESVLINFTSAEEVQVCIDKFNNRYYDGLKLNVSKQ
ncbi:CUS2 Cold sensitive U2 snRNA suppressor 2 [Candida maltosa Xu316]